MGLRLRIVCCGGTGYVLNSSARVKMFHSALCQLSASGSHICMISCSLSKKFLLGTSLEMRLKNCLAASPQEQHLKPLYIFSLYDPIPLSGLYGRPEKAGLVNCQLGLGKSPFKHYLQKNLSQEGDCTIIREISSFWRQGRGILKMLKQKFLHLIFMFDRLKFVLFYALLYNQA